MGLIARALASRRRNSHCPSNGDPSYPVKPSISGQALPESERLSASRQIEPCRRAGNGPSSRRVLFVRCGLQSRVFTELELSLAERRETLQPIDSPFGTRLSPMSQVRSVTHVSGLDKAKAGGDGGIRTLDRALQPYNGLANRRLQPLGHVSVQMRVCPTRTRPASLRFAAISCREPFRLAGLKSVAVVRPRLASRFVRAVTAYRNAPMPCPMVPVSLFMN